MSTTTEPTPRPESIPSSSGWRIPAAAAFLAGIGVFCVGETTFVRRPPGTREVIVMGVPQQLSSYDHRVAAERRTALIAWSMGAAAAALATGAAVGFGRGSPVLGVVGGLGGGAVGVGLTLVVGRIVLDSYFAATAADGEATRQDMLLPLLVHGGIDLALGLAAGLAAGIAGGGWMRLGRGVVGGLLGGLVAAVVGEVAAAMLFPSGRTDEPIAAAWQARMFYAAAAPTIIAGVAAAVVFAPARRPAKAPVNRST